MLQSNSSSPWSIVHTFPLPKFSLPSKSRKTDQMEKIEFLASERNQDYPKSPEFEFRMVTNPSLPQPHILTADQLFSHGILLPLHTADAPIPFPIPEPAADGAELVVSAGPELTAVAAVSEPATGSRRWKDILKKSDSKSNPIKVEFPKPDTKRERRTNSGGGGGQTSAAAELNIISIWPFSRSRSAKTSSTGPKVTTGGRKASSAPCSRSNSGSESKSRKLPGSPARGGGVHVGRSSPVWQCRRGGVSGISRLSVVDRECVNGQGKKNGKSCKEEMAASGVGDIGCGGMRSGGSHDGSGVVNRFSFRCLVWCD